MGYLFVFLIK
jgi:hypothetical protein